MVGVAYPHYFDADTLPSSNAADTLSWAKEAEAALLSKSGRLKRLLLNSRFVSFVQSSWGRGTMLFWLLKDDAHHDLAYSVIADPDFDPMQLLLRPNRSDRSHLFINLISTLDSKGLELRQLMWRVLDASVARLKDQFVLLDADSRALLDSDIIHATAMVGDLEALKILLSIGFDPMWYARQVPGLVGDVTVFEAAIRAVSQGSKPSMDIARTSLF
jgi:hypothetical protein